MKVVFIFAHPDDETFSSAGTIIKLRKKGVEVVLITATRGEAGQLGDPPVTTQENLGKIREQELRNAAKITGIQNIYFLDFIDGTLVNQSDAKLLSKIWPIVKKEAPDVIVTFNAEGGSRHPDHMKIHTVATHVFEKYLKVTKKHVRLYYTGMSRSMVKKLEEMGMAYTAFGKIEGTPDEQITTIVDIKDVYTTKIKALRCHVTQRKDWERFLKGAQIMDRKKEYFTLASENMLE